MTTEEKMETIMEVKTNILNYLNGQQKVLMAALAIYDTDAIKDSDTEIKRMRETEAIKLRDRLSELNRHIATIELL